MQKKLAGGELTLTGTVRGLEGVIEFLYYPAKHTILRCASSSATVPDIRDYTYDISELAVRVQPRKKHIYAKESEAGDQQANQRPIRSHSAS